MGPPSLRPSPGPARTILALTLLLVVLAFAAFACGGANAPWRSLASDGTPAGEAARRVLLDIRLPRILLAVLVGA